MCLKGGVYGCVAQEGGLEEEEAVHVSLEKFGSQTLATEVAAVKHQDPTVEAALESSTRAGTHPLGGAEAAKRQHPSRRLAR